MWRVGVQRVLCNSERIETNDRAQSGWRIYVYKYIEYSREDELTFVKDPNFNIGSTH